MRASATGKGSARHEDLRGATHPPAAPAGSARWPGSARARLGRVADRHGGPILFGALCAIVAAGFALRMLAAFEPRPLGNDSIGYYALAESLYRTGSYDDSAVRNASNYNPGTPLVIFATYLVTGGVHPGGSRVVIGILGTIAILFTYLIARRLAGGLPGERSAPVAGLVAAVFVALYPSLWILHGTIYSETVATFFLTGAVLTFLWVSDGGRLWRWLVPGAFLGATALTRPEYLVAAVPLALYALVVEWRRRSAGPGWAAAAIFLAGAAVMIAPWTIRNYVAMDRFVPISTGGGKIIFMGTNLEAGGQSWGVRAMLSRMYPETVVEAERRVRGTSQEAIWARRSLATDLALAKVAHSRYPGLPVDEALGRIGRDDLGDNLRNRPFEYLEMAGRKMWNVWWVPATRPTQRNPFTLAAHRILFLLGVAGLALAIWKRRYAALVAVTPIVVVTLTSGFLVAAPSRRSVPMLPLEFSFAAFAIVFAGSELIAWRNRRRPVAGS